MYVHRDNFGVRACVKLLTVPSLWSEIESILLCEACCISFVVPLEVTVSYPLNVELRECSKSPAYGDFSLFQILMETDPLSFHLRLFVGIDECKSALSVVKDRISNEMFVKFLGYSMRLKFPTNISSYSFQSFRSSQKEAYNLFVYVYYRYRSM